MKRIKTLSQNWCERNVTQNQKTQTKIISEQSKYHERKKKQLISLYLIQPPEVRFATFFSGGLLLYCNNNSTGKETDKTHLCAA